MLTMGVTSPFSYLTLTDSKITAQPPIAKWYETVITNWEMCCP